MIQATAPGKVILFGEHAVVYGRPALAAPLSELRARASIEETGDPDILLAASDFGWETRLADAGPENPLVAVIRNFSMLTGRPIPGGIRISVSSEIPIASGLGSGAAIAVAVIRALAGLTDKANPLGPGDVSRIAYEVERIHHGTPSGIDNTVIAFEMPVYFVRREPEDHIESFSVAKPLRLLIGDTGQKSATRGVVGDVRRQWESDRRRFEEIFDGCGRVAMAGRAAMASGDLEKVGSLMNENHDWLTRMTVSSASLDKLVAAARRAGALGAKLSGAGRGGNMIALVTSETESAVRQGLTDAGAVRVYSSDVG